MLTSKTSRMKSRLKEIFIVLNCLVLYQKTTIAYEPTTPDISLVECVWDLCSTPALPSCSTNVNTPPCVEMYGCGYDSAGETVDACTTHTDTSKHIEEKHYRLT